MKMRISDLISTLQALQDDYGDKHVTCKAGDSYFPTVNAEYDDDEDEVIIECKDLNY